MGHGSDDVVIENTPWSTMKNYPKFVFIVLCLGLLAGCTTTGSRQNVEEQEVLQKVNRELDEEQLLDVWIALFDPGELPVGENESRGLSMEIREAEARFIPAHLRGVMEKTGFWGAVRVVPEETAGVEVLVRGTIKDSDGEKLTLEITALDASGRQWFSKTYRGTTEAPDYNFIVTGTDSFEPVYHAIANDLARFRDSLTEKDRITIRRIAAMRFAAHLAPSAFAGHISDDGSGSWTLLRLPAEDDPVYQRVQGIRDRDFLLIDTLNGHYDNFYREMDVPYGEWRKARSIEGEALREARKKANIRKAVGVAAILGAIAIEVLGGQETRAATGTARDVMVLGGLYSIKSGIDLNAQTTIHKAAIEELGISFSAEAKPLVVEVEGETHKLTGSAEAQYKQWQDLMKKIYAAETGLEPESTGPDPEATTE